MHGKPQFATSADGTRIAFEAHGAGAPLCLLHGFSDAGASWTAAGYTEALVSAGHRVVLIDARGHGNSDHPTLPAAYCGRHLMADLTAVLDALGLQRTAVMGFSMGGVSALAAAAFLSGRVTAAVTIGAHPYAEDLSWLRTLLAGGIRRWIAAVEDHGYTLDPEVRTRLAANDLHALRALASQDRSDFSAALAASRRPVLALLGERDPRITALPAMRRMPRVQVLKLIGANHFASFLAARDALPEITRFLAHSSQEVA